MGICIFAIVFTKKIKAMIEASKINYFEILKKTDTLKCQIEDLIKSFQLSIPSGLYNDFEVKSTGLKNTIENIVYTISDYEYK